MSRFLRFMIVFVVIVLDQISKVTVDRSLELYEQIKLLPVFNITLAYNEGAAFSFLSEAGGWQRWLFTTISFVVSVVLTVWLYRMTMREKLTSLSIALILGGAVGNLIDRAIYGHVVDFIQVHYKGSYFPSFNIADSSIFCGTALLLWLTLFDKSEEMPVTD